MEVLISGGGIGGLTSALCMAQYNASVQVFERRSKWQREGLGIQLSPNAMQVLNQLGLAAEMERVAVEPKSATVRDFQSGRSLFTAPLGDMCERLYGAKYLQIYRPDLMDVLRNACTVAGVRIHTNAEVDSYTQDKNAVTACLSDGQEHLGDLLIGADGLQSKIRSQMHSDALLGQTSPAFSGYVAWRATVDYDATLDVLNAGETCVWRGPGSHVVAYWVKRHKTLNVVAVQECEHWPYAALSVAQDVTEFQAAFSDFEPSVQAILSKCKRCTLWGVFDHPPLPRWRTGRVVLLGDACHPMPPFMAQGGAMAIEDSFVLAHKVMTTDNLNDALRTYESVRQPRTAQIRKWTHANIQLFHRHNGLSEVVYGLLFRLLSLFPSLTRYRLSRVYNKDVTRD